MSTAAIDISGTKTLTRNANKASRHTFTPGRKVNALYDEDGEHYPATYVKRNSDGTHHVKWDDGGEHADVDSVLPHWKSEASVEPIERGAEVAALYDDGEWYPAVYVAERANGDHRVRWIDGSGVNEVAEVEPIVEEAGEADKEIMKAISHSRSQLLYHADEHARLYKANVGNGMQGHHDNMRQHHKATISHLVSKLPEGASKTRLKKEFAL